MLHALVGLLLVSHPLAFSEALTRADAGPAVAASQAIHAERAKHARDISSLTANPVLQVQPGARAMEAGGTGALTASG